MLKYFAKKNVQTIQSPDVQSWWTQTPKKPAVVIATGAIDL